jgi:hypothetical protein
MPDTFDAGYVTGAVVGDGGLQRITKGPKMGSQYEIVLRVTCRAFALKFRSHLEKCIGRKAWMTKYAGTRKANSKIGMPETAVTEHAVGITSRQWWDWLSAFKHRRNYESVLAKSDGFRLGFLQGLLDAEGYVFPGRYLDIANKDMHLLDVARQVVESFGLKAAVYGPYSYSRGVAHLRAAPFMTKTTDEQPLSK